MKVLTSIFAIFAPDYDKNQQGRSCLFVITSRNIQHTVIIYYL